MGTAQFSNHPQRGFAAVAFRRDGLVSLPSSDLFPLSLSGRASTGILITQTPNVNNLDAHGMFSGSVDHSIKDCTDGTSNTFLIGERDTLYCRAGTWIGVRNPQGNLVRGFYYNTANVRVPLNAPDPPYAWNSRGGCSEGFSSLHPGGANFALADASVRFISDTIEFRGNPPGCSQTVNGSQRNCYDNFSPGNRNWEPVFGVYKRLGRRNDGFVVSIP